jgi:heme ABC exporter ATP-binding subunit CcmA
VNDVAVLKDAVVVANTFPLLSGVTVTFSAPGVTVLTGGNGAGKTSLLRLIAGLSPLTSGSGEVLGVDLMHGDRRQLRRRVGWLGHEGSFYDELTVMDNLRFAARALDRPLEDIAPALERVGLTSKTRVTTKSLSAGQRRRLALAWLLVRRPSLWVLDEPYASLDDAGRNFLDGLLGELVANGIGIVLSAHDALREPSLQPRTLHMAGGRIVEGSY